MNHTGTHIKCPHCNEFILYNSATCHYCGRDLNEYAAKTQNPDPITLIKNELKGKYEIYELIGKGGMASVYRARQINLDRIVALKVIHPHMVHDREFVIRFLEEAKISAQLSHPNVVNIYDFGQVGDIYYISMQYLDGRDLSRIIRETKKIPPEDALRYTKEIAEALNYIHSKGYLHRDIKSSNIFITADNKPVITDFGIAYHAGSMAKTVAGTLLGTPEYLSPEQAAGKAATPESDYYSLGIVLYECLTGELPFTDTNPVVTINKITRNTPQRPANINPYIPKELEEITLGLINKNPASRKTYIRTLLTNTGKPISVLPQKPGTTNINTIRLIAIVTLSVLLIGIIGAIIYTTSPGRNGIAGLFPEETRQPSRPDMIDETAPELSEIDPSYEAPVPETEDLQPRREPELPREEPVEATLSPIVARIENSMQRFDNFSITSQTVCSDIWNAVMAGEPDRRRASALIKGHRNFINNATYNEIQRFFRNLNALSGNPYNYDLPTYNELLQSRGHSNNIEFTNKIDGSLVMYINQRSIHGPENFIGKNQKPERIGGGLEITFSIVRRHNTP